jgi:hypothetical protein
LPPFVSLGLLQSADKLVNAVAFSLSLCRHVHLLLCYCVLIDPSVSRYFL